VEMPLRGAAIHPRPSRADSYPHITNGGEQPGERPPAGFATRASLSKWFAIRKGHHGQATQACDFRPRSEPMVIVAGACAERVAMTASIRGSITSAAGRSGS
jgi:hypothetical protein